MVTASSPTRSRLWEIFIATVMSRSSVASGALASRWIAVSSIASFVGQQSDIIVLGLLLPGPVLGVFFIARMLTDAVEGLIERLNSTLTLPVLSEVLRNNPQHLRDRYYRFRLPIDLLAAGGAGAIAASANDVVSLLYDSRYAEAGPMLQVLAVGLLLYPLQVIRSAFTAIGRTRTVAAVSMVQAGSLLVCMLMGYWLWGGFGAIVGIAVNRAIPSVIMLRLAFRQGWISPLHEMRVVPIFAAGFAVAYGALAAIKAVSIH